MSFDAAEKNTDKSKVGESLIKVDTSITPQEAAKILAGVDKDKRAALPNLIASGILPDTHLASRQSKSVVRSLKASSDQPDDAISIPTDDQTTTLDQCSKSSTRGLEPSLLSCVQGAPHLIDIQLQAGKPTVAFLDEFDRPYHDGYSPSHGDLSAKAAQTDGLGVVKIDHGTASFAKSVERLVHGVEDGSVPLKPGDFVNLSFGDNGWSFDEASRFLNLKDKDGKPVQLDDHNFVDYKEKLIDALHKSEDPEAKQIASTYDQMMRLRARGITVIGAEYEDRDGHGMFDPNMLGASYAMRATDEKGEVTPYSGGYDASGNKGRGSFELQFVRDEDGKSGQYQLIGGKQIYSIYSPSELGRKILPADRTEPRITNVFEIQGTSFANIEKIRQLAVEDIVHK